MRVRTFVRQRVTCSGYVITKYPRCESSPGDIVDTAINLTDQNLRIPSNRN